MKIMYNLFPGGVQRALTMSYDDGQVHDRHLVEIFNKYGIRGTFHLNSGMFDKEGFVRKSEVKALFKNHEVSVHTTNHPYLTKIPDTEIIKEIIEDKKQLERLCEYIVRGMSYPYGHYSENVIEVAKNCGMEYSRTVEETGNFELPRDFMKWHPTAHHNDDLTGLWERFTKTQSEEALLLYIWGHSFEFDRNNNWEKIEEFCKMASGWDDVWYATNIEIKEYLDAIKRLVYSGCRTSIYNPSAIDVWLTINENPVCINGGTIWKEDCSD